MRQLTFFFLFISSLLTAQVTDNFSDGDFTSSPSWSGDATEFIVNATQQLQLNNTVAGASYLSTLSPASSLDNTEWRFYIKQTFAPSGSNYGRVYLASDQANLEGSLNGYYLQFGEAGSLDAVELFRQTGLTSTSVARGTNGQIAASFSIGIKVTRDASGNWSLYVDPAGATAYALQATGTDIAYTTTSFFGVATVYTISSATKFFFDDFYNGPVVVDTTPPSIISSTVMSATQLDVLFSETVEITTAQTTANYSADNGLGNPSSATRDATNLSLVHLTFATPFSSALLNTLTVNNVQDLSANAISGGTTTFTYTAPVVPAYRDIIINEIFADPSPAVGLPGFEFIEIYNRGTTAFNLNGWKFSDGTSTATLGGYTLAAGQYLIICPVADTASFSPFGPTMGVGSFPSLNNTDDNLTLKDNTLTLIDSVDYLDTWYQDAVKMAGGWTLELINPNAPLSCPASGNWIASNNPDGGTPGTVNSVYSTAADIISPSIASLSIIDSTHITLCYSEAVDASQIAVAGNYNISGGIGVPLSAIANSGLTCVDLTLATPMTASVTYTLSISNISDCSGNVLSPAATSFTYTVPAVATYKNVIINEIFADPSPQVGLPLTEFIEIYNNSASTFNLNGWKFTDGSSTATLGNYDLLPNTYLIVCPLADTASWNTFGAVMGVSSFPSLNNTGDNLYLKNSALSLIDSVNYSDSWYQDAVKDDGGWTLELINPNAPVSCATSNNWIASNNASGGTPGIQNSVYSTAPDLSSPSIVSVSVLDSAHISVCFSEAVDISQIALTGNYTISAGIGMPSVATPNSTYTCVDLALTSALSSATTYTLSITGISDCSGNALSTSTATFDYYKAQPFDVLINEIMADPDNTIGLPAIEYEYVELYNRTAFTLNLKNWKYTAGTNTKLLPDVNIPANGYIVLTSTTNAPSFPLSANAIGVTSFPSLTNTGQTLTLRTPQGTVISSVSYTDDWYGDDAKKDGGWSLEQIDPSNPCEGMNNWKACTNVNGGTPGALNSVNAANPDNSVPKLIRVSVMANDTIQLYFNESLDSLSMLSPALYTIDNGIGTPSQVKPLGPDFKSVKLALPAALSPGIIYGVTVGSTITDCVGNPVGGDNSARFALPEPAGANDIVINEVLYNPKTGGVDFVEIYNRSSKVIDLKTMILSQYDTINNVPVYPENISTDGYLMFPGDYLVLSENGNTVKSQYSTTNPEAFLDMQNIPTMSIESGTVCLSVGFFIIDHFVYYDNMQFPLLNDTKGVSLERIDFDRPTNDRSNWHSAAEAAGYATPGYKNSQYTDAGETDNAIEITPEVFSPDEDGNNDVVNINYHFDSPGFVANVTIYDSKGRLVKNLIRNELLGSKGTFSWDGINEEREKARIGIYIVFVEVFDVSGKVKHCKKTCVLAGKLDQ
jgi:hypothetical protein